jgi:predicted CoA-binding protein
MEQTNPPTKELISKVLKASKTIAVVGLSDDPAKPAHTVSSFLKEKGYTIVPVHPKAETALGEKVYQSLDKVPGAVDLVYIFLRADLTPPVVDDAIKKGARAVWMPEGIVNEDAAKKARDAGLSVVMDRCALKEIKAGL